jgi:hypothetical protein
MYFAFYFPYSFIKVSINDAHLMEKDFYNSYATKFDLKLHMNWEPRHSNKWFDNMQFNVIDNVDFSIHLKCYW